MAKDPFYNPNAYQGETGTYVSKKKELNNGKITHRYVYGKPSAAWDDTPSAENSFEIGNKRTGSTINISCTPTNSVARVVGLLRNKDGEVMARIEKSINTGSDYFDEYRKWMPNKTRMIMQIVEELKLHDRPIQTMRDIDRSMQDIGMFPEEFSAVKKAGMSKSALIKNRLEDAALQVRMMSLGKSLDSIRQFHEMLGWGHVSEQTRRQMVTRAKEAFDLMSTSDQAKAMPYMLDILQFQIP